MDVLYPRVSRHDLPVMLRFAFLGAAIAGVYGSLHDQFTYSISPEYFTRLKFQQFSFGDLGLPERLFVAEIGFLATSWVGLVGGWLLARAAVPNQPRPVARRQILTGFGLLFSTALVAAAVGCVLGRPSDRDADYASWHPLASQLGITDLERFVHVAYIHNAGYAGGLVGLIAALVYTFRHRKRHVSFFAEQVVPTGNPDDLPPARPD